MHACFRIFILRKTEISISAFYKVFFATADRWISKSFVECCWVIKTRPIQSFVECWILKFIVLFNLKYSDFIYLCENNIHWIIIFISMMFIFIHGWWRSKHQYTWQNASTVLFGSAAFRVSGSLAVCSSSRFWKYSGVQFFAYVEVSGWATNHGNKSWQ